MVCMKKILVLGCNGITDFIVPKIMGIAAITEIIIASRNKAECDALKNKYSGKGPRITTARMDIENEQGTRMMLSITNPDIIVNLLPIKYCMTVMKLALEVGADYIDGGLYECGKGDLLSKQFSLFAEFRSTQKTAITGCSLSPALLTSLVKNAMQEGYDAITSAEFYEVNLSADEPGEAVSLEDGKVVKHESKSVSIKLDENFGQFKGTSLYLSDSPVIQDFIKEIPGVPNVRYYVSYEAQEEEDFTPELTRLGMLSDEPVQITPEVSISPKQFWEKLVESRKTEKTVNGVCGAGVVVEGTYRGSAKKEFVYFTSDNDKCMEDYGMTSIMMFNAYALLSGVTLLCMGRWDKKGVFTPIAFDSEQFVSGIRNNGLYFQSKTL